MARSWLSERFEGEVDAGRLPISKEYNRLLYFGARDL